MSAGDENTMARGSVGAAEARADRRRRGPLADRPLALIEREIESLAAQISAGSARWLELVAEFDRREGWGGTGCRSTAEWVAWRCALTSRSAREHVRVARALPELPEIRERFASGELSYSKVRALTRVADTDSEAELCELARYATAAQLERMVRAARRCTTADADEAQRESFVRWYWDDAEGCLRIEARLPPEDGAQFLRALEAARDALHEVRLGEAAERADGCAGPLAADGPSGSAEPSRAEAASPQRPLGPITPYGPRRVPVASAGSGTVGPAKPPPVPSPSNAESLAALAEAALARPPTGLAGGERHQVILHVDARTLATDEPGASMAGPGECALADGPGIAPETARRLACDASVVALIERDGDPLSVGRRARAVPTSIRRALLARDGRCQFPGCERHRFVDAHHIRHWAHGGNTSLDNLVLLCRHHHRLVHEGGFSVSLDGQGQRRFALPDGCPIEPSPSIRAGPPDLPTKSGPLLTGTGEKMDLAPCVDAVLVATGRGGFAPATPR